MGMCKSTSKALTEGGVDSMFSFDAIKNKAFTLITKQSVGSQSDS